MLNDLSLTATKWAIFAVLVVIGGAQVWVAVQIGRALRAGWRWCMKAARHG